VSRRGRNTLLGCGLVLLLLLGACSTDRVATGAPLHAFTDALDDEVPRLMKRFGVPGVAIAIIRDGEPAWSGAYGLADRETDVPMTVDTVCRAESISKSVTAWGIMKLVEQGEIEMDGTPVPPYVYPAHASGGLFVTVDDVALFVAASVGSATVPGTRVLSDAGRREMYRPRATIPGLYGFVADAYGLGHFVEELPDGRTAVWHGGQGHGWMTHFHAVPESGEGIVVLTNSQRSWPLIASILPRWASWSGIGTVRFGVITPATRVFWAVIAAVGLVTIWLAYRLLDGVFRGNRLWAPFSGVRPVARLAQGIAGVTVLATVLWRISLPYVDEASIFPTAVPWAAVALIALGSVLVVGAAVPRRGARDAAPPP
jgi:hypothetical protein